MQAERVTQHHPGLRMQDHLYLAVQFGVGEQDRRHRQVFEQGSVSGFQADHLPCRLLEHAMRDGGGAGTDVGLAVRFCVQSHVQVLHGEDSPRTGLQVHRRHAGRVVGQFERAPQMKRVAYLLRRNVAGASRALAEGDPRLRLNGFGQGSKQRLRSVHERSNSTARLMASTIASTPSPVAQLVNSTGFAPRASADSRRMRGKSTPT